ncbi:MAG: helix-turn-helix domain-containing protein [Nitrososphaerota archaeon]|nr:helix-turn-helix domain-containing protein [Nitrososphaerota archaeon]
MRPTCELSIKYLLPAFRSAVARHLVKDYGLTQQEVARMLGTTQAAISHYLRMRRGKVFRAFESSSLIRSSAQAVAAKLASSELDVNGANSSFCRLCEQLERDEGFWAMTGLRRKAGFLV